MDTPDLNEQPAQKADILLVVDTPENLRVLSQILTMYGYKARAVPDGILALTVARAAPPDLIMMDINMPGMDGYETCQRLKADERTQHIPVIFLSAMSEVEDKVKGFEAGGVDYITKPFQVDEVLARLETHLAIRRLQEQLEIANSELADHLFELSQAREAERQQRILAELLVETISAINSSLDYNEVLDLLLVNMGRVVPHDTANIALINEQGMVHVLRSHNNLEPEEIDQPETPESPLENHPLWKKVAECHCPIIVADAHAETNQEESRGRTTQLKGLRSHVCVPILSEQQLLGFINLGSSIPHFFTDEHVERMKIFADQAAVAIEKARLFNKVQQLATLDGLTGVYNRRHLLDLAQREYARTRRYNRAISALMIDLDHFKRVNDTYGHPIGDLALIALTRCCQKNLRPSDLFGRYGGEEFLVLLPETDMAQAIEVAERLCKQISEIELDTEKGPVHFTASVGVATLCKDEEISLDQLIVHADDALYAAKAAGRNRVAGYQAQIQA